MRFFQGLIAVGSVLLTAIVPAKAAIVLDGNFNDPLSTAGPGYTTYSGGSTFGGPLGTDWTVIGTGSGPYGSAGVDLIGSYWGAPSAGGGSVDLDGNAPGGISQSIVAPSGSYVLSFYLSGNPDGAPGTKTLSVSVGSTNQTYYYTIGANTHSNMRYQFETLPFTLNGPTTLSFTSLDANGSPWGPVIAGVSISAVPETATWVMIVMGFSGIGFFSYGQRVRRSLRLV